MAVVDLFLPVVLLAALIPAVALGAALCVMIVYKSKKQ